MAPSSSTMPLARVSAKRPSSVFSTRCACSLPRTDRKSTRLNSSHSQISYAVFCLKKKNPPADDHDEHDGHHLVDDDIQACDDHHVHRRSNDDDHQHADHIRDDSEPPTSRQKELQQ